MYIKVVVSLACLQGGTSTSCMGLQLQHWQYRITFATFRPCTVVERSVSHRKHAIQVHEHLPLCLFLWTAEQRQRNLCVVVASYDRFAETEHRVDWVATPILPNSNQASAVFQTASTVNSQSFFSNSVFSNSSNIEFVVFFLRNRFFRMATRIM